MKKFLLLVFSSLSLLVHAQFTIKIDKNENWKKIYRSTPLRENDLIHTKLSVRFDYDKSFLYGEEWITLHPHFYATDSVNLDAKGMVIHELALMENGKKFLLDYTYDSMNLHIQLNRTFHANEPYTLYIRYTAKPNELKVKGSEAITDAKGLYFINPRGFEKNKPTQIWTQGETEGTSVWCPTIDNPNQKTTQEISMTVPDKFITLSNGMLISQQKNLDGTRTDYWKMDEPHAPYLIFMGIGDYAVIKDHYKEKEVNYYVEKDYASEARKIFGETPEMMGYFSNILQVEYPWSKYAQITARDYVSGAMENTTATLHSSILQQNARQLSDGNKYEIFVAHELFHHWFGDLVTAESWSNLTLNESFAQYSEVLWGSYKHGKDMGEKLNDDALNNYLESGNEKKSLVRYYYKDKEDLFDLVTYNKGSSILYMLQHYLGDRAFFSALHLYLERYKFKSAEVAQLRMAFEEVSGKDLNWFFNQWYFGLGHPKLDISYNYEINKKQISVLITQKQNGDQVFKLPIDIDIYETSGKTRHSVWLNNKQDTFNFPTQEKPLLVNVDADKILVAEKEDHKTWKEFIYQYLHAGNYVDRKEALEYCVTKKDIPEAANLIFTALTDTFYAIRNFALKSINTKNLTSDKLNLIETIATSDSYRPNRAEAIKILGGLKDLSYKKMFAQNTTDSSYTVAGAALLALSEIDKPSALSLLPMLKKDAKEKLLEVINQLEPPTTKEENFEAVLNDFKKAPDMQKFNAAFTLIQFLQNETSFRKFKKAIESIIEFRNELTDQEMIASINRDLLELKNFKINTQSNPAINNKSIDVQINFLNSLIKD